MLPDHAPDHSAAMPGRSRGTIGATVAGVPVTVRPGFWMFSAALLVAGALTSWQFAVWLVVGTGVLNLLHEFGHALTAKAFGARVSISLDAVAGRTHLVPTSPLPTAAKVAVVLAGPLVHIAVGLAAVRLAGADPLSLDTLKESWAAEALWWAGPVLGALNLLPLVPLDGGMVLAELLDRGAPGRGLARARWAGCGVVACAAAVAFVLGHARLATGLAVIASIGAIMASRTRPAPMLPSGDGPVSSQRLLIESLVDSGQYAQAGLLGSRAYELSRDPAIAALVARSAAALGDRRTADAWLAAAGPEVAASARLAREFSPPPHR